MQVEQKNLWENVAKNAQRGKSSMAIAAYEANIPQVPGAFDTITEQYTRTKAVSESGTIDMATYENPAKQEEKTAVEEFEQQYCMSAENRKNEMIVVSNTTSVEDLKKIEEEGYSLYETDSHTIITVTDKIKAVLAKAGVDTSYFGDSLSKEQLEKITGSPVIAENIMHAFTENDLPLTTANLEESAGAFAQAAALSSVGEESMAYLLQNEMEPTIRNLYLSNYSSSAEPVVDPELSGIDFEELIPQIGKIIESAGLSDDPRAMDNSKWLIANKIPLTPENLKELSELQRLSGDMEQGSVDWNEVADAMAKAVADGKRPEDASMLTAYRKREESRLLMTSSAGAVMEKTGMKMDLQPLEDLVDDLKNQEQKYYGELLKEMGAEKVDQKAGFVVQTLQVFEELKVQPAYILHQIDSLDTVKDIYVSGAKLQRHLELANESYETLMMQPCEKMGDSLNKAFAAVDNILSDLGLSNSERNQRAVRILAYNQTDITEENILAVKEKDEQMQRAFSNMKPAVTLEMIRRGVNPLDMTMEQLNEAAEEIRRETGGEEQERFSKFLWKLEKNSKISEEERSSYIGIYRLIAQVEKEDGAALGFLMKQGTDVTMRNLLTAVRSKKKSGMDYSVDDDFDGVESTAEGQRIDEQISAAFQTNCLRDVLETISPEKLMHLGSETGWQDMTPEQLAEALMQQEISELEKEAEKSYAREQLTTYQQTLDSPDQIYAYLERYDIANSMLNVMAVSEMFRKPNQMMDRLFKENRFSKDSKEKVEDLKNQVLQDFSEALKNPSELADAQETLADVAEHVMDTMIIEDPEISTLDIRAMRQTVAQFSLCARKTEEECYMVPIQTGDSVTGVSLKIVRGKKQKGFVDIFFEGGKAGKVAASLRAKENGISGTVSASEKETASQIAKHLEELQSALGEPVDLHVACNPEVSLKSHEMAGLRREQTMEEQGELAEDRLDSVQTTRLYHIAESFIQSMKAFLNQR